MPRNFKLSDGGLRCRFSGNWTLQLSRFWGFGASRAYPLQSRPFAKLLLAHANSEPIVQFDAKEPLSTCRFAPADFVGRLRVSGLSCYQSFGQRPSGGRRTHCCCRPRITKRLWRAGEFFTVALLADYQRLRASARRDLRKSDLRGRRCAFSTARS